MKACIRIHEELLLAETGLVRPVQGTLMYHQSLEDHQISIHVKILECWAKSVEAFLVSKICSV